MRTHITYVLWPMWFVLFSLISGPMSTAGAALPAEPRVAAVEAARNAILADRFAELEASLGMAQTAYEADTNAEDAMNEAFRVLQVADPDLEPHFDLWIAQHPRSYAARVARGQYLYEMGYAWRGTAWANKTHPGRFKMMHYYLERAYRDLGEAVTLTGKPVRAYSVMIRAARLASGREVAGELLERAIKTDPYATGTYLAYASLLAPRWGGSHEAMHSLAANMEGRQHPKLLDAGKQIRADVIADKADQSFFDGDRLGALKEYQEALVQHPRHVYANCMLGTLYGALGQIDNGLRAVDAGLKHDPYNTDCLMRRVTLLHTARRTEAMRSDMHFAATLGHPEAIRQLGLMLADGLHGVPADVPASVPWLERAAYFWEASALFQLGLMHERGIGVPINHARSVDYYRSCANLKDVQCENNLGMMLWYGKGTAADHDEAARLWIRVHKQGAWQGRHNLEYFFSPTERVVLAFRHGPGIWALAPLATLGLIALGVLLIVWILIARPFAPRRSRPVKN